MRQLGAFSRVDRDPRGRVVSIAFRTLTPMLGVRAGDDAARAEFVPVDSLYGTNGGMAFDHMDILGEAICELRNEARHPASFLRLMDMSRMWKDKSGLTFYEAQTAYEAIMDRRFDVRNFVRSMKPYLRRTKSQRGSGGRPARLHEVDWAAVNVALEGRIG
jgi:8-oxo-dGTP diphosphatase